MLLSFNWWLLWKRWCQSFPAEVETFCSGSWCAIPQVTSIRIFPTPNTSETWFSFHVNVCKIARNKNKIYSYFHIQDFSVVDPDPVVSGSLAKVGSGISFRNRIRDRIRPIWHKSLFKFRKFEPVLPKGQIRLLLLTMHTNRISKENLKIAVKVLLWFTLKICQLLGLVLG